jgi:hypothetical protein
MIGIGVVDVIANEAIAVVGTASRRLDSQPPFRPASCRNRDSTTAR